MRWVAAVILLVPALLLSENVFINTGLHLLLNLQPERVRITWDRAWTIYPGDVEVVGLAVRVQEPVLQWMVTADHATGHVDVAALTEYRFVASHLRSEGVTFRARMRRESPRTADEPDATPPIDGFENPSIYPPEALYGPPGRIFRIELTDLDVTGVHELWVEDFRLFGDARITGALQLHAGRWVQLDDLQLDVNGAELSLNGAPLASAVKGTVNATLTGVDPAEEGGTDILAHLDARAVLSAQGEGLQFLSYYLRKAPWLRIDGGDGPIELDVSIGAGKVLDGSRIGVNARGLRLRFLSYMVTGDGNVRVAVSPLEGVPEAQLAVEFFDYAVRRESDKSPMVKGTGLRVTANTASLNLTAPFETLDVGLELPDSEIPDLSVYNDFLPRDLGSSLVGGRGRAHGGLTASTEDGIARGDLYLRASDVRSKLGAVAVGGDVSLHAHLAEGHFETGVYVLSGTTLSLKHVNLVAPANARKGKDDAYAWWAEVTLPRATVSVGAPVFLDAKVTLKCRDSVPFVTLASRGVALPGWTRGLLKIKSLSGEASVLLGDDTLVVPQLVLRGRDTELRMRVRRRREEFYGALYARYGILSLGVELLGPKARFHVFGPRRWYDRQTLPGA